MPVIPLKQLSYTDAGDPRRIVDAINANFRYLDWLLNQGAMDKANIPQQTIYQIVQEGFDQNFFNISMPEWSGEFLEYASAPWNASGVQFVLTNAYTTMPVTMVSVEVDAGNTGSELDTASFTWKVVHLKETFDVGGTPTECYSKINVTPVGSGVPSTIAGGKISIMAICFGMVAKPV